MMKIKNLSVYLSGEIHTDWRDVLIKEIKSNNLPINFYSPITDHAKSDDCGAIILGKEEKKFWHDHKGASVNSLRNTILIKKSDIKEMLIRVERCNKIQLLISCIPVLPIKRKS